MRAAATELAYRPNAAARTLSTRRTGLVGVVIGNGCGHAGLTLTFFGRVLEAVSRSLLDRGYEALLVDPVDVDVGDRVDGVILVGVADGDPILGELAAASVPCVGVDFETDLLRSGYVGSDNVEGMRLAVRHLYALGHRRIATISGPQKSVTGAARLAGFREEADALGLDVPEAYVRIGDYSAASGYREAQALVALASPPTAIVAASDHMGARRLPGRARLRRRAGPRPRGDRLRRPRGREPLVPAADDGAAGPRGSRRGRGRGARRG